MNDSFTVSGHDYVIPTRCSTEIKDDRSRCWRMCDGCAVSGLGSVIPATDRLGVEIQVIIVGVIGVLVPWPGGTIHKFLNDVPFVPD